MNYKKEILVCPLSWGLGHASRIIPIVRLLQKNNHRITIGAYNESYEFLKKEFPEIEFIYLKGLKVKYSRNNSQLLKMFFLIPKIIYWTIYEHYLLKKILKRYSFDVVISDNRFGLWDKNTYSIFITHQLRVKFPGVFKYFEFIYAAILRHIVNKYNECWIPDFQNENNLSGELSHTRGKYRNNYFIGPLSRFQGIINRERNEEGILFILSGPEPQRTIFENIILSQSSNIQNLTIVRGTNRAFNNKYSFPIYDVVNTSDLVKLINKSEMVICRAGYSSIMDLNALNKKAVIVPTPGQTEQEYLARYLKEKGLFNSVSQDKFEIKYAISNCFDKPSFKDDNNRILLERIKMLDK